MKKLLIIAVTAMLLIAPKASAAQLKTDTTDQKLYEETIVRLIYPVMLDVVSQVHGKQTMLDYESMNVIDIKAENDSNLILKLKLMPFTGEHNTLSTDYITLRISTFEVQIINYESSGKNTNKTDKPLQSKCNGLPVFLCTFFL